MLVKEKYKKTYSIWCAMRARCNNQNVSNYFNYGGRGIKVCKEWDDFYVFLADMGEAQENDTIERIDCNGNYEPKNCKWATRKEQGNNKRNNRFLELNGQRKTATQWSEITGIGEGTIRKRLKLGWPVEKILTEKAVIGRNQTWSRAA